MRIFSADDFDQVALNSPGPSSGAVILPRSFGSASAPALEGFSAAAATTYGDTLSYGGHYYRLATSIGITRAAALAEASASSFTLNGQTYQGQFAAGKPDGMGRMTQTGGFVYEGQWKAGLQSGQGRAIYADGTVYTGQFLAGLRDGKGRLSSTSGFGYVGDWKAGVIDGQGIATYATGEVYEGAFVGGEREGQGKLTYSADKISEGVWQKGLLVSPKVSANGG